MRISVFIAGAMALGLALGVTPANATVTYTYTGAPLEVFDDWSGGNRITGWMTLESPLAANLYRVNVTPISFSFSAGLLTVDNSNANLLGGEFRFSTDAAGRITDWANYYFIDFKHYIQSTGPISQGDLAVFGDGAGFNAVAGTWSSLSVPEPATWSIMTLGFGALGATLRRRRAALAV